MLLAGLNCAEKTVTSKRNLLSFLWVFLFVWLVFFSLLKQADFLQVRRQTVESSVSTARSGWIVTTSN